MTNMNIVLKQIMTKLEGKNIYSIEDRNSISLENENYRVFVDETFVVVRILNTNKIYHFYGSKEEIGYTGKKLQIKKLEY